MSELDGLYILILQSGLAAIRNAARNGDLEYCAIESEHLHEIPSLIGEPNILRHRYYATQARPVYLEWAMQNNRENVRVLVDYFYSKPWKRMDVILGIDPADTR
jgi:hypothetical protein